jgi:hypothetical protein
MHYVIRVYVWSVISTIIFNQRINGEVKHSELPIVMYILTTTNGHADTSAP